MRMTNFRASPLSATELKWVYFSANLLTLYFFRVL